MLNHPYGKWLCNFSKMIEIIIWYLSCIVIIFCDLLLLLLSISSELLILISLEDLHLNTECCEMLQMLNVEELAANSKGI